MKSILTKSSKWISVILTKPSERKQIMGASKDVVLAGHRFRKEDASGLLLFKLLHQLDEVVMEQIQTIFGQLSNMIVYKLPELIIHFNPESRSRVENAALKADVMTLFITNLGLMTLLKNFQSKKEISEKTFITTIAQQVAKEPKQKIQALFMAGRKAFKADQEKSGELIDINLIPIKDSKDRIQYLSLFSAEDEGRLKKYFTIPAKSFDEQDERQEFYNYLNILWVLSKGLGIIALYQGVNINYEDSWNRIRTRMVEFHELEHIKLVTLRQSKDFETIREGVLPRTIGSLIMRLTVAVAAQDDLYKNGFELYGTLDNPIFKFTAPGLVEKMHRELDALDSVQRSQLRYEDENVRQAVTNRKAQAAWKEAQILLEQRPSLKLSKKADVVENHARLLLSCMLIDISIVKQYLILCKREGSVEERIPIVAAMVKAILQDSSPNLTAITGQTKIPEIILEGLNQVFIKYLEMLKKKTDEFIRDNRILKSQFDEVIENFWGDYLIFAIEQQDFRHKPKRLASGEKILTVEQICQLKYLDDILLHISNFSSWDEWDKEKLVDQFPCQRFIEFPATSDQFLAMMKVFNPSLIADGGTMALVVQSQLRHWPRIWERFNWLRNKVNSQILIDLYEYAYKYKDQDLMTKTLYAANQVKVTIPRVKNLVLPVPDKKMETADYQSRHPVVFIWLNRLENEGKHPINFHKASTDTVKKWLDWAFNSNNLLVKWYMFDQFTLKQQGGYLKKFVPSNSMMPNEELNGPKTEFAQAILAMNQKADRNWARRQLDEITFISSQAYEWYKLAKQLAPKTAKLVVKMHLKL